MTTTFWKGVVAARAICSRNTVEPSVSGTLHVDQIHAVCGNSSTNCGFSLAVLGNSTGT